MIKIEKLDALRYQVTINAHSPTTHIVSVNAEYARQLTGEHVKIETLLEKSFEFLLAREPNTSILRSFDLSVITHYFPDYPTQIALLLA